ncbi:MAG: type II toxin-antitoxin system VapC family toxin [Kiritimatiellia bacterium]
MICLDTSFLINALLPGSRQGRLVIQWIQEGEAVILPAVTWYEFLCGATEEETRIAKAMATGGIRAFEEVEASQSARLFKESGKPRRLRVDVMIAGTAIGLGAVLASDNRDDFAPFVPLGLRLL